MGKKLIIVVLIALLGCKKQKTENLSSNTIIYNNKTFETYSDSLRLWVVELEIPLNKILKIQIQPSNNVSNWYYLPYNADPQSTNSAFYDLKSLIKGNKCFITSRSRNSNKFNFRIIIC